jgi:hypothetical protein
MAPRRPRGYLPGMRYDVTLSAPSAPPKTYSVEGESESEATGKANSCFMAENPGVNQFDVKAEIHAQRS